MDALDKIWDDIVFKKLYLTGGIGAAGGIEGFGPAYDLPNATRLRRDLRHDRLRPLELADVPVPRRREIYGPLRAGRLQRLSLRLGHERRPVLLSEPARLVRPAPSARPGSLAPAARRTSPASSPSSAASLTAWRATRFMSISTPRERPTSRPRRERSRSSKRPIIPGRATSRSSVTPDKAGAV